MNNLNQKLKKAHKRMLGLPEPPSPHAGRHDKDKTRDGLSDLDMYIKDMEDADRRRQIFLYVLWTIISLVLGVLLGIFIYWTYILGSVVHDLLILFFEPLNADSVGW